jgi:hypothetical protein
MADEQVIAEQMDVVEEATESEETPAEETADEEEAEETEAPEGDEENEPKKKLTAQERIQQLANERREERERADRIEAELTTVRQKAETLEREFRARQETQAVPEYIEVTEQVLYQVNQRLAQLAETKTNAELQGNYLQGIAAQKEIDAIYQGLQENAKRAEKAQQIQQAQSQQHSTIAALDERAEFFRQQNNIPADVWNEGGNWFAKQCETDGVLGKEFVEIAQYSGPMAAIRFAADYTARNKPKPAAAVQQKEEAKSKLPGGTGKPVVTSKTELSDDLPMSEWRKLREKQKYK